MKDVTRMATIALKRAGDALILIGETRGHLGQSIYLREVEGRETGAAPPVHLPSEKRTGDFVRKLIEDGRADTVHDCSDGGLLVALAEMAMAGNIGLEAGVAGTTVDAVPFFFGEDQARYVLSVPAKDADAIEQELRAANIVHAIIGKTIAAKTLRITGHGEAALTELRKAHEDWLPKFMSGEEIPPTN
jgi:phosphoribosylformylglycinamidine synthase